MFTSELKSGFRGKGKYSLDPGSISFNIGISLLWGWFLGRFLSG